jgi:hypothetical protein
MEPFATTGDLEGRWREFSEAESSRAEALLAAASRLVRAEVPGIDARIPAELDRELVADVVCEMVQEVMSVPVPGVTQQSSSLGGVSISTSFSVAAGRLKLTAAQLRLLRPLTRRGQAGSISSLPASGVARAPGAEAVFTWH